MRNYLSNVSCAGTGGKNCNCGHCQHMKKMSEFNLSKKEWNNGDYTAFLKDDVKEFIKIIDKEIEDIENSDNFDRTTRLFKLRNFIKEKAGDNLI